MTQFHHPAGLPGVKSEVEATARKVLISGGKLLPGGIIVDGSESRDPGNTNDIDILRAGLLMGKLTSNGRYAPTIIGTLSEAYDDSSDSTTMNVSAAVATEINRRIGSSGTFKIAGPPTAGGTVNVETVTFSAVNTSTGAITISAASQDYISGSFIMDTDGSETPRGLLLPGDRTGYKVTDQDDNNVDVPAQMLIGGHVAKDGIVNWPSDSALQTWVRSKLNGGDGTTDLAAAFTFADVYSD